MSDRRPLARPGLADLIACDPVISQRAIKALFQMVKLDIAALKRAYDG